MSEKRKGLSGMVVDLDEKVESLEDRLSVLESHVSVNTQMINSIDIKVSGKVDKESVISAINISNEGIRINGDKIHIDKNTLTEHNGAK